MVSFFAINKLHNDFIDTSQIRGTLFLYTSFYLFVHSGNFIFTIDKMHTYFSREEKCNMFEKEERDKGLKLTF